MSTIPDIRSMNRSQYLQHEVNSSCLPVKCLGKKMYIKRAHMEQFRASARYISYNAGFGHKAANGKRSKWPIQKIPIECMLVDCSVARAAED